MNGEDRVLEVTESGESTTERVDWQLWFLEWWVNDTELSKLQVAWEAYRAHLLKTGKSYDEELSVLFSEIREELKRMLNKSPEKEEKEAIEEDLLLKLVEKIWILWTHFWFNRWEERLVWSWNPEFRNETWIINIWNGDNCFFVPWCFLNLRKLLDLWIIQRWNIHINLWAWVNMQEAIWFVKTSWRLWNMTFERFQEEWEIEKISITTWSNCSFAHWASFYPWRRRSDIEITAWSWVFFWINSLVWSWSVIWENSTIWWNANLWNDVKIWDNVIIWTSSVIEDWIEIPNNSLIPNFAVISKWFSVVSFDEYRNDPNSYVWRKNFVISLSENDKEKKGQLDFINSNYNFVRNFNWHNVVPENKIFAAVEDVYSYLEAEIWFQSTRTFEYEADEQRFDDVINNSWINWNKEKINWFRNAQRKSRMVLKAYPKNAERFLIKEMPALMTMIETLKIMWKWLSDEDKQTVIRTIEWYLDRPSFDEETMRKYFFWNTYITWKFNFSWECLFFNLKSRWDELQENEDIHVFDWVILWWVIHWWWNKKVERTKILDTTIHWWVDYLDSTIWEYWKPSVLNSTVVKDSTIWWHFTCNWAEIFNTSIVWARVSIAWWNWKEKVVISNSTIWEGSSINTWAHIKDADVNPWIIVWKYMNVDWLYIWSLQ